MLTPSKEDYVKAKEVVAKYESRQKELVKLNEELGKSLRKFKEFKFDVDKNNRTVYFAGVVEEPVIFNSHYDKTGIRFTTHSEYKLVTGKAVANHGDMFEEIIGKLISVKRALGEDYEWVYDYVESYDLYANEISSGIRVVNAPF